MSAPPARWEVRPPPDAASTAALAAALHLPPTLAGLLVQRGLGEPEAARRFLKPSLEQLSDPLLLPDMDRAVETIARAVKADTPIVVHGDYDVDGQCAAALLTRVLRAAGATVHPFIPNRVRDGYDLGPAGVAFAAELGARLIVTCDCGITAHEAVRSATEQGIDVVVTDHHLPGTLPAAVAVVNPRRDDSRSPADELCGTGVVFKLVQALAPALGLPETLPLHFLDLVALATVADVVPLTGENRVLTRLGLKKLHDSRWPGIRALIEASGLAGKEIRAGHVGFVLGPRLNAAGRIGDAMFGLALLLTDDPIEAADNARGLETLNARRQALDQEILDSAIDAVEREIDLDRTYGLVLAKEGWHPGVIGIVASRIVERYARPTFLIAFDGAEEGKGSGRSIPAFDLHGALTRCAPHLVRYGGHRMAAGLTIRRDQLDAFRDAFNTAAMDALTPDDLVPTQRVDALVGLDQLDDEIERLLRHLEPCGTGNPAPVFGVEGARGVGAKAVGTNHVRFTLDDGRTRLGAIGFGWADRVSPEWWRDPLDVAFRLERNEWRGTTALQARVVHIRPAG